MEKTFLTKPLIPAETRQGQRGRGEAGQGELSGLGMIITSLQHPSGGEGVRQVAEAHLGSDSGGISVILT